MAQIDDYWQKITANPKFEALAEDRKEEARQRFFDRYIASSRSYQDAPEDRRNSIRDQYDKRIMLPKPKPSPVPGQAIEAAKEGLTEAGKSLASTGQALTTGVEEKGKEVLGKIGEARRSAQEATPIPALKSIQEGIRSGTEKIQEAIEPSPEKIVSQPKTATAQFGASGIAGTAGEFAAGLIPGSWEEVAEYAAMPFISKAAGKTFLGLPFKQGLGIRSAFPMSAAKKTVMDEMANILTAEKLGFNAEQKLLPGGKQPTLFPARGESINMPQVAESRVPENGIRQLANIEETAKYQKWLEDHSDKVAQQEFPDLYPQMKVNHSQMIDEAKVRLQRIQDEGMKMRQVSEAEKKALAPAQLPPGQQPTGLLPAPERGFTLVDKEGGPKVPKGMPKEQVSTPPPDPEQPPIYMPGAKGGKPEAIKPGHPAYKSILKMLQEMNEDIGKKGEIGPGGQMDPAAKARLQENAKELIRRAREAGMESTEDIMAYAAAHASDTPVGKMMNEHLKKTTTLNKTAEWPGKEMEAAQSGSTTAKAGIVERGKSAYERYRFKRNQSHELVWKKDGDENALNIQAYFIRHDALQGMSDLELKATPFVIEKKIPSLESYSKMHPQAAEIIDQAQHPTPAMLKAAEILRPHEDEARQIMNALGDDVDYKQDYLHHRWDHPDDVANWIDQRRGTADPFSKESVFDTYADGIEAGFKMKDNDIREGMAQTDRIRNRLISRYRLRTWLDSAKTFDGKKALLPETEAPPEYQRMEGKAWQTKVTNVKGQVQNVRMAVSPDYRPLIEYVYKNKSGAIPYRAAAFYNTMSKQANLAYSLFHGQTLAIDQSLAGMSMKDALGVSKKFPWIHPTESSPWRMVAGIGKSIKAEVDPVPEGFENLSTLKQFSNRARAYGKAYLQGNPILQNRQTVLDAAEHNVVFDSMPDLEYNLLSRVLRKTGEVVAKVSPQAALPFKAAATGVDVQLKGIFTYIRNMGAIITYQNHLADNLKAFPDMPVEAVKNQTGRFVGKMYGGVAMTALMVSPEMAQFLHVIHFAPDWFYSTWMREQAAASGMVRSTGSLLKGKGFKDPEARQATFWMARLALGYAVVGNLVNYAMWKKYTGKGKFMFNNEPGHELDIFGGYYPNDKEPNKPGRIRWIVPGRGFTDPYDAYMNPWKYAVSRTSPALHAMGRILTGTEVGGYQPPKQSPGEATFDYVKKSLYPFSFTGQTEFFTWPVRKGMGYTKTHDLFLQAYQKGEPKYRQQAIEWGRENHLGGGVLEAADGKAKAEWIHEQAQKRRKSMLK